MKTRRFFNNYQNIGKDGEKNENQNGDGGRLNDIKMVNRYHQYENPA